MMNTNKNLLELKNKNYIYNKLYINSIKLIYNQIKINNTPITYNTSSSTCNHILKLTSNERFNIECILNKLFVTLGLDFNLQKFGRSRTTDNSYGRQIEKKHISQHINKLYIPFNFMLKDDYKEPLFTPINITYKLYNDKVKNLCIKNNDMQNLLFKEPLLRLLHSYHAYGYTINYKNIPLTSFYYELNDDLYNELNLIPIHSRCLTSDMNMYRAIYHTDPKNHPQILEKINKKYKKIIDNVNTPLKYNNYLYHENLKLVRKIYWLLSHATLYERGSCAITEIFCNALLLYISAPLNKPCNYFKNKDCNTDIEAMLECNPNNFIDKFDSYVLYYELSDINQYFMLNMKTINDGITDVNINFANYNNIEDFDLFAYLFNFKLQTTRESDKNLKELMKEFSI